MNLKKSESRPHLVKKLRFHANRIKKNPLLALVGMWEGREDLPASIRRYYEKDEATKKESKKSHTKKRVV